MLSFFKELKIAEVSLHKKLDTSTSGKSAHVFTSGQAQNAIPKDTTRIRIDKSIKHLNGHFNYGHIFSMELPETVLRMDANLIQGTSCLAPSKMIQAMQTMVASYKPQDVFKSENMRCLRNLALPPDLADKDLPTFDASSTDLGRVLPTKRNNEYLYRMHCNCFALRSRFDGLPLHRICYYQSHDSAEVAIRNLAGELGQQSSCISMSSRGEVDCIGMTPLHILACSTKHHLDMYRMLISRYPNHLVMEDAWGDIPLLYALWGRAPWEVVQFLAASMREHHESYCIDWEKMIETLCVGLAPISCIEYLIETNKSLFPGQTLEDVRWNYMVQSLCTKAKAPEEHIQQFIRLHQKSFSPKSNLDLERVSLELSDKEKFAFKPFWLRIGVSQHLPMLGKNEWRANIEYLISTCPTGGSERNIRKRFELMKTILRKVDYYEMVAQMWVLELALWKAKIEETENNSDTRSKSYRSRCQFTSGADVIIPNVMEYLITRPSCWESLWNFVSNNHEEALGVT